MVIAKNLSLSAQIPLTLVRIDLQGNPVPVNIHGNKDLEITFEAIKKDATTGVKSGERFEAFDEATFDRLLGEHPEIKIPAKADALTKANLLTKAGIDTGNWTTYLEGGTKGENMIVMAALNDDGTALMGGASVTYGIGGDDKLQIVLVRE